MVRGTALPNQALVLDGARLLLLASQRVVWGHIGALLAGNNWSAGEQWIKRVGRWGGTAGGGWRHC